MLIGWSVGVAVGVDEGEGLGVGLGASVRVIIGDAEGEGIGERGAEGAAGVIDEASAEVWLADRYISDGDTWGVSAQAEIIRQTATSANQ